MATLEKRHITSVAGLILLALLIWGYFQLPFKEEEIDLGFGEEAKQNPYLASDLFLKSVGNSVNSLKSYSQIGKLPKPLNSTLIMATKQRNLTEGETAELLAWIEKGGHLITNASKPTDFDNESKNDVLLHHLGIDVYLLTEPIENKDPEEWLQQMLKPASSHCTADEGLIELSNDNEESFEISISSAVELYQIDEIETYYAANNYGVQLLQMDYGEGSVTLLTDMSLWSNNRINCLDHAYFLKYLVASDDVAIIYRFQKSSLLSLMWTHAKLYVLLSLSFIFLWLWHKSQRFGPLLELNISQRRSLLEHINASAVFVWRKGSIDTMIEPLRSAIRTQMLKHHSGFKYMTPDEQYKIIARITHLDPDQIRWAFDKTEIEKPLVLERLVKLLQTIKDRI